MCIVQCMLFWPVEEIAELAVEPTGCGEMARVGCSLAWNYSVARTAVLTEVERRTRAGLAKCNRAFPNCL
jgi:hypothetical protein